MKTRRYRRSSSIGQTVVPVKTLSHRITIFVLIAASISLIIFARYDTKVIPAVRSTLRDIITPVLDIASRPFDYITSIPQHVSKYFFVYSENQKLVEENKRLKTFQSHVDVLITENKKLKELMNYSPEPGVSYVTGRISAEMGGAFIKYAVINIGENKGVKKDQVVINDKGVIGRIHEVGSKSSGILLLTDSGSRIPVITNESRELGIASGDNKETLKLLYFPHNTQIKVGEEVYSSGDGNLFPSGLLVGHVLSVKENEILIKPAIDWSRIEYANVVNY